MSDYKNLCNLSSALHEAVKEIQKRRADVSDNMAIDCIVKAIECGDFMVHTDGDGEYFDYIPYRRVNELLSRIAALEIRGGI